jgi:hypothetical protein
MLEKSHHIITSDNTRRDNFIQSNHLYFCYLRRKTHGRKKVSIKDPPIRTLSGRFYALPKEILWRRFSSRQLALIEKHVLGWPWSTPSESELVSLRFPVPCEGQTDIGADESSKNPPELPRKAGNFLVLGVGLKERGEKGEDREKRGEKERKELRKRRKREKKGGKWEEEGERCIGEGRKGED